MKRFVFTLLSLTFFAAPLLVEPQPVKPHRIGYLSSGPGPDEWSRAFLQGMRELGYVEGRNLAVEYRWAGGKQDQLPRLASELVDLRVDLIVASPTTGALAAKRATKTIPIVVPISVDAIGGMLAVSGAVIDVGYVEAWSQRLGVGEIWAAIRRRA